MSIFRNLLSSVEPLPEGFASLQNLQRLELGSNQLLINLTAEFFGNLSGINLQYLGLAGCPIERVSLSSINQCTSLKTFNIIKWDAIWSVRLKVIFSASVKIDVSILLTV